MQGSVQGVDFGNSRDKAFEVMNAVGAILFAFSFSMVGGGVGGAQWRGGSPGADSAWVRARA